MLLGVFFIFNKLMGDSIHSDHTKLEIEYLQKRNKTLELISKEYLRDAKYEDTKAILINLGLQDDVVESPGKLNVGGVGLIFRDGVFDSID